MSAEGYISTTDAAARLGITRQRVLQLIEGGRLPASLFANVYMIREADLKLIGTRTPGRPRKSAPATQKRATGRIRASNGTSTGKQKGRKK
jgi:excisionase family DNA binding protein